MFNDFANWKISDEDKISHLDDHDALKIYMEEKYAMSPGEGNILDTVQGMNSPPMEEAKNSAAVMGTLASCSKKSGNQRRKKRSDEGRFKQRLQELCFRAHLFVKPTYTSYLQLSSTLLNWTFLAVG